MYHENGTVKYFYNKQLLMDLYIIGSNIAILLQSDNAVLVDIKRY